MRIVNKRDEWGGKLYLMMMTIEVNLFLMLRGVTNRIALYQKTEFEVAAVWLGNTISCDTVIILYRQLLQQVSLHPNQSFHISTFT
jgi:hypothetical protein